MAKRGTGRRRALWRAASSWWWPPAAGVAYFWRTGRFSSSPRRARRGRRRWRRARGSRSRPSIAGPERARPSRCSATRGPTPASRSTPRSAAISKSDRGRPRRQGAGRPDRRRDRFRRDRQPLCQRGRRCSTTSAGSPQRNRDLLTRGNVSLQAAEQSATDLRVAEGIVRNLATMKSYETLRAPFAGTVTARFADPGALVQNADHQPNLGAAGAHRRRTTASFASAPMSSSATRPSSMSATRSRSPMPAIPTASCAPPSAAPPASSIRKTRTLYIEMRRSEREGLRWCRAASSM